MKYFTLPNLSSQEPTNGDPTTFKRVHQYPPTKAEFRKWCLESNLNHCFYSVVEGLTPSLRVSVSNPPKLMHGLVIDYDAQIDEAMEASIPSNGAAGLLPRWVNTTYSGGRRLIWEFEEPILVDNKELNERFLKWLGKELKVNNILPGLDNQSFNQGKYFELGKNWKEISKNVIPSTTLSLLVFKAANERVIQSGDTQIPIEVVAAEVERRFPGRWPGDFSAGARGPLFWIDDGIDRVGCQVGDFGMICYSERAGKSFLSWREILGHDFVRTFEASRIGAAAEGLWFDGSYYYRKGENGSWQRRNKEDQIMWLKGQGISARISPKDTVSDAERVLLAAQESRTVQQAVPFVLDSRELVIDSGYRYLNVSVKRVMEPAESGDPAQFPWLHQFLNNIWDKEQHDYFISWLKRFYVSGVKGSLKAGHALFIAGDANRGKTLLNRFIIGKAVGGFADATSYLLGETHFNKECGENALWCVDDAKGLDTQANKRVFAESIKKQIANPHAPTEAKFKDSVTLPWKGRIVVTTNTDPDSLTIIPALDGTIADKVMMFKFGDWTPIFEENEKLEAKLLGELPYFLRWLTDWKDPEAVVAGAQVRYGINHYHHKDLVETAQEVSVHHGLQEALDVWAKQLNNPEDKNPSKTIELTGTELLCQLQMIDGLKSTIGSYRGTFIGRSLRALAKIPNSRVLQCKKTKFSNKYVLDISEK